MFALKEILHEVECRYNNKMRCKKDVLTRRKEYMEFTVENYDFKKAMQQLINEKLKGILLNKGFVQYKKIFMLENVRM